jgi:hypothetical protein
VLGDVDLSVLVANEFLAREYRQPKV